MRTLKFSSLAIVSLALIGTLVPSVAASAATRPTVSPDVTCSGAGCTGGDAISTGCSSTAITAKSANIYKGSAVIGVVQLRYSTACLTAWAKIITYTTSDAAAFVQRSDGHTYSCNQLTYDASLGGYSCYTPMVYDHPYTSLAGGSILISGVYYTNNTASY